MTTKFQPIFFGEYHRYCAVCVGDYYFVADAEKYDKDNNDRATITYCGEIARIRSLVGLVSAISFDCHKEYINPDSSGNYSLWMLDKTKEELIYLYEKFISEQHGIILFSEDSLA